MCCISKPWWLKVQQMSGTESSYSYSSVRMKLKRTSVPSVTCCLPSSVIWLKGKDTFCSVHQYRLVWFLLFWIVFRKTVVTCNTSVLWPPAQIKLYSWGTVRKTTQCGLSLVAFVPGSKCLWYGHLGKETNLSNSGKR